jgi:hypothetical protein
MLQSRFEWLFLLAPGLIALASFTPSTGQDNIAPAHLVVRVTEPNAPRPVECAVAINPTNPDFIIGVSQQGRTNVAYVSKDAGRTWKTIPTANPGKRIQGDDTVTFSADGLAFRSYISFTGIRVARPPRAANGIFVSTSRDGSVWSDPVPVIDHLGSVTPYEDKPWIRADTLKDSSHHGNVYVAWTRFDEYGSKNPDHKTHIYFARSKDSGKSFSVPHRISKTPGDCLDSSKTLMGAVPAVGPKGEVYVVWAGPKGLAFVKSTDGGWEFGNEKILSETPGGWDFNVKGISRCNGLPVIGVDLSAGPNRGTIYVCWTDLRNADPDVFVIGSRDGGDTWTKPLRVNDDPKANGKEQFLPWMADDPVDGAVNIVFYDRRETDETKTGLILARSINGGKAFVNHKINQEPFACHKAVFFGDYIGIDAYGGRTVAMYQHFVDAKRLALSAAIFDFKLGTQEAQVQKKPAP